MAEKTWESIWLNEWRANDSWFRASCQSPMMSLIFSWTYLAVGLGFMALPAVVRASVTANAILLRTRENTNNLHSDHLPSEALQTVPVEGNYSICFAALLWCVMPLGQTGPLRHRGGNWLWLAGVTQGHTARNRSKSATQGSEAWAKLQDTEVQVTKMLYFLQTLISPM